MNCIHVEFEVPGNNFLSAGSASDSVKSTLKKLGVPAPAIRRVAIAMYEAEINMVIHAGGGRCYADIFDDHIRIVMKDEGNGIADVDLAMQEGYSTATDDVRNLGFGAGMGLPNMKRYTDSMEINSTVGVGTDITMRVML